MESQPQNPEFRNNPENFHPCSHCDADGQTKGKHIVSSMKSVGEY